MRVVFFTDSYEPQIDGVVRVIKSLEQELRNSGNEIFVVCPGAKGYRYENHVYPLRSFIFKPYPEYRGAIPSLKLLRWFKNINPDIVHVHSPATTGIMGIRLGKKFKKPIIITYHTLIEKYFELYFIPEKLKKAKLVKKVSKKFVKKYTKYIFNKANLVIAPSSEIKELLRKIGVFKPIVVLPSGIDTNFFRPMKVERENVILWVGRLCKGKNLHFLFKAVSIVQRVTSCKFIVVGDGPEKHNLEKFAKRLKIDVEFKGHVKDNELPLLYSTASVFVSPSKTETQGLTVLEALACGCPVVVANALGFKDFVKSNVNGFLVRESSIERFANKIIDILLDSSLRNRLSKNARKTALSFSLKNQTRKLLSIYKVALDLF